MLTSTSQDKLQTAFNCLAEWARKNKLKLNEDKTVSMTFRRGGKQQFLIGDRVLKSVSNFKYLGVTFQTQGHVFTKHISERMSAAKRAINDIDHQNRLSLATAMKLFQLKVAPVATYGLENIWTHLRVKQLENIEKIKGHLFEKSFECVHVHPFMSGL
jgi:hypothetical protein